MEEFDVPAPYKVCSTLGQNFLSLIFKRFSHDLKSEIAILSHVPPFPAKELQIRKTHLDFFASVMRQTYYFDGSDTAKTTCISRNFGSLQLKERHNQVNMPESDLLPRGQRVYPHHSPPKSLGKRPVFWIDLRS